MPTPAEAAKAAEAARAPDAWLVRSALSLAETVAIFELHRLDVKCRRNSDG
jgi:hypothetical protein